MFKKISIVAGVLLIVLLATGCGGSDKASSSEKTDKGATAVATTEAAPTSEASNDGSSDSSLNPLSFLTGQMFGGEALAAEGGVATDADPDLKAVLLTESDLPSGYSNAAGDTGYSLDMPQGQMKMAMRTFGQGDLEAGPAGPVVMSAAMSMPASALSDFDSQLGKLDQMSPDDLQKQMGAASALGIEFKDVSLTKTDLGDGGVTMHMVMDMSGLAEAFGGSAEEMGAFGSGIAFDAYIFKHGDRVLMLMAMWPAGESAPVDAQALAKKMDSRA